MTMISLIDGETATEARRYVATGLVRNDAGLFANVEIHDEQGFRGTVEIARKPMQRAMRPVRLAQLADAAFASLEADLGPQDADTAHPTMGGF